jgi:hypothetical protein
MRMMESFTIRGRMPRRREMAKKMVISAGKGRISWPRSQAGSL